MVLGWSQTEFQDLRRFIAGNSYQWEIFQSTLLQWEISRILKRRYVSTISGHRPYIGLKKMVGTSNLGSWVMAIDYWVPTNSEPATPLCDGRDPWRPWRGSMMFTTPSPTPWAPWANAAVSTAGKRSMTRPRRSCTAACGSPMAMRRTGAFFGMPWDVHHLGSSFYMFLWWSQQANYI